MKPWNPGTPELLMPADGNISKLKNDLNILKIDATSTTTPNQKLRSLHSTAPIRSSSKHASDLSVTWVDLLQWFHGILSSYGFLWGVWLSFLLGSKNFWGTDLRKLPIPSSRAGCFLQPPGRSSLEPGGTTTDWGPLLIISSAMSLVAIWHWNGS